MDTKVHRINRFKQDSIIRDYINLHTETRANAENEPERDTYKLMNKAVFGLTCENPPKHIEARIPTDEHKILKSLPYQHSKIALIDLHNKENKFENPIYLVVTVLELSKLHLYYTLYNVLKSPIRNHQCSKITKIDSYIIWIL